jgi:hypothetical protein
MTRHFAMKYFLLAALVLGCGRAWSQTQPSLIPRKPAASIWPVYSVTKGDHVLVVPVADGSKRLKCKVASIDADELVCTESHGKKVSYSKDDVAGLIRPRETRLGALVGANVLIAIGGAIFYGAICVATISTPLIAVAVPIALGGAIFGGVGIFGVVDTLLWEHPKELLLYQRAGDTQQLTLRG